MITQPITATTISPARAVNIEPPMVLNLLAIIIPQQPDHRGPEGRRDTLADHG